MRSSSSNNMMRRRSANLSVSAVRCAAALALSSLMTTTEAFHPSLQTFPSPAMKRERTSTAIHASRLQQSSYTSSVQESFSVSDTETRAEAMEPMQEWAVQCGVVPETGFSIVPDESEVEENIAENKNEWYNEQFYALTSTGGIEGSRVLYVPGEMILSAARTAEEYQGYIEPCFAVLAEQEQALSMTTPLQDVYPHFYLFVRILVELEQYTNSPYYPWLASMPRHWNSAVSMTDFCLSCLPPYLKSKSDQEQRQFRAFSKAVEAFEYLTPETKNNADLLRLAYNVVRTRSVTLEQGYFGNYDVQIIPVGDLFNHGDTPNVVLQNDPNDSNACHAVLTQDVSPGQPLLISYDPPVTNPAAFLATYGFINGNDNVENGGYPVATYCKLLFSNPSPQLLALGANDPSRMLFYTENGGVAPDVWNVLLYSRLERKRSQVEHEQMREAFYNAIMQGDEGTKHAILEQYQGESTKALLRHVDFVLAEVNELMFQMYKFDASKHPRLPLLRRHHEMVISTFQKVRQNLVDVIILDNE